MLIYDINLIINIIVCHLLMLLSIHTTNRFNVVYLYLKIRQSIRDIKYLSEIPVQLIQAQTNADMTLNH